jgi:hypothetical protein
MEVSPQCHQRWGIATCAHTWRQVQKWGGCGRRLPGWNWHPLAGRWHVLIALQVADGHGELALVALHYGQAGLEGGVVGLNGGIDRGQLLHLGGQSGDVLFQGGRWLGARTRHG